jgi:hypothetical protein
LRNMGIDNMSEDSATATEPAGNAGEDAAEQNPAAAAEPPGEDRATTDNDSSSPTGRWVLLVGSSVTVLALIAIAVIGFGHVAHQRAISRDMEKTNAAWDFMELLFAVDDTKSADAKMAQLKLRTADPLRSNFENRMAPLYEDFAQFGTNNHPLHVTSASFLTGGPPLQAAQAIPGATVVLITASARKSRGGRGNSFWLDVIDRDDTFLIADVGVAGT